MYQYVIRMTKVYYVDLRANEESDNVPNKIARLMEESGLVDTFDQDDMVALKTHFGEPGNTSFLRPIYLSKMVEMIKDRGGIPFLTDSNTLYKGGRSNAVYHIKTAARHGFSYPVIDAPVIIADGLRGEGEIEIEMGLKHCRTARISSVTNNADSIIGVSHFKAHLLTGFGGALKNIGMGLGSIKGKLDMHKEIDPEVEEEDCVGCGICSDNCPQGAIIIDDIAVIDKSVCIGCGECFTVCPHDAVDPGEDSDKTVIQEKIAEYSLAVLENKMDKSGFVNFVMDVTPHCDCASYTDRNIVPDIGILASRDIIALDQACADLVNDAIPLPGTKLDEGKEIVEDKLGFIGDVDWRTQLQYGEEIGLGTLDYDLIRLDQV